MLFYHEVIPTSLLRRKKVLNQGVVMVLFFPQSLSVYVRVKWRCMCLFVCLHVTITSIVWTNTVHTVPLTHITHTTYITKAKLILLLLPSSLPTWEIDTTWAIIKYTVRVRFHVVVENSTIIFGSDDMSAVSDLCRGKCLLRWGGNLFHMLPVIDLKDLGGGVGVKPATFCFGAQIL